MNIEKSKSRRISIDSLSLLSKMKSELGLSSTKLIDISLQYFYNTQEYLELKKITQHKNKRI